MTTIQKIKQLLELDKVSISFKEAVLDNGTKVITEGEFVIGAPVFVIGEDEKQTPAPNGEHKVPELKVIITTENGIITKVSEMESEEKEEEEEMVEAPEQDLAVTPEEQTAIIIEVMKILETQFAEISKRIDDIEARMNEGKKVEADLQSLKTQVETFVKLPGGESKTVIDVPVKKNRESLEDKLQKFKRITNK